MGMWIDGTVVHSGDTYRPETDTTFDLRPCLHFYLNSHFHKCDLSLFTTCRTTATHKMDLYGAIRSKYPALNNNTTDIIDQLKKVQNNIEMADKLGRLQLNEKTRIVYQLKQMSDGLTESVEEQPR